MDKRQEEQKLFRWYLSKVNRRTNIPEEEVDKWFVREDDWRHLEDYGIYIEEHKDNFYGFNPYDRKYDNYFGRKYLQDCAQTEEQTRRFLARSAEIVVFKAKGHQKYGAMLERTRLKSLWMKRLSIAAVVFAVLFVAGCGIADYFGLGRHTLRTYYVCNKYMVPLFSSEKNYNLDIFFTNNPKSKKVMYMAFKKSDNIFDTLYIDSARIIDGRFTFKGKIPYPVQAFLSTVPEGAVYSYPSTTSVLYLDTEKPFQCEIDLENPSNAVVKGSAINDDWKKAVSLEEGYFKETSARTRENSDDIFKRILDSLPADSPINLTYLTALALTSVDNLDYVKERLYEMPWVAKSSPAGLRLWRIIDKTEHTERASVSIPEFKAVDDEGNTVHSSSLIGKGKGMAVFYFWVPGGEYTKFGDYQKEDFAQLQAIYDSSPKGSVSIVTICASTNTDKLAEWKQIIPEYEGKEGWTNLRYYIDHNTFEIDNIYNKMYLEGKLPVTLLVNPSGLEFVYLEGLIDRASTKIIKDYVNWSYTYKYIIR